MRKFKEIISVALIFTLLFTVSTFSPYAADDKNEVYIGGEAFGVKFYANGAMIIKLESYYDGEKYVCPAKDGGLKVNDIIKKVNNTKISTKKLLLKLIETAKPKIKPFCRLKIPWEYISSVRGFVTAVQALEL